MQEDEEETITLTKSKMKETVTKAVSKAVDKIWTQISSTQVFASNVDMETHLRKDLKFALLEAELQLTFPELGLIRKNIIIKSFLLNHSQDFDTSRIYDVEAIIGLKFDQTEDTITVSADIEEVDLEQFELVLEGCRTKRINRDKKNQKMVTSSILNLNTTSASSSSDNQQPERVCVQENKYRKKFLSFLKSCYFRSGIRGFKEALQGGLNNQVNIEKIKQWENALAEHLKEFLFLNYEMATFESPQKEFQLFTVKDLYNVIHNIDYKHRQNINYAKRKNAEKEGGHTVRKRTSATEFNGNSSQYNVLAGLGQRMLSSGSDS